MAADQASWVESYTFSSPWSGILSGAGSWLLPGFIFLAGLALAGALLYIYTQKPDLLPQPFFGLEMPKIPGVEDKYLIWVPFAVVGLFTVIMLLSNLSSVAGGVGSGAAGLSSLSQEVANAAHQLQDINATAAKVSSDLDKLLSQCPPAINNMLGSSVSQAKSDVRTCQNEASLTRKALSHFPELIATLSERIGSFSGMVPFLAAVAVLATVFSVGAEAVVIAGTQYAPLARLLVKNLGTRILGQLIPACAAAAILLLCVASASELSAAAKVIGFCSGEHQPDAAVLAIAKKAADDDPTAYSLAQYYIAGKGSNPAIQHLSSAKAAVGSCSAWLSRYLSALKSTCPQWEPSRVQADLHSIGASFNQTQKLLQPTALHGQYRSAMHEGACLGGSSSLASLAIQQAFLALVCLPLMVLTGSWLQDSLSKDGGGAYQKFDPRAAHQSREQHLDEHDEEKGDSEQDFNVMYYVVYAFSVVVFGVGLYMYLVPQPGLVRPVTGALLFACGIFLLMNSDLIVTYMRLHEQVGKFKANNERFEQGLQQQGKECRRLQTASKGLEEIDRKFGGSVQRAMKEVKQLQTSARCSVGMSCKELCRLYFDKDKDRQIDDGEELDASLDLLATIFGALVKDLRKVRVPKLKDGIKANEKFQKNKGLSVSEFSEVFECALFQPDPATIPQAVNQVLDHNDTMSKFKAGAKSPKSPGKNV